MTLRVEGLVREEESFNDFSADEELERERGEHVQTKAEPRHIDQRVILSRDIQLVLSYSKPPHNQNPLRQSYSRYFLASYP